MREAWEEGLQGRGQSGLGKIQEAGQQVPGNIRRYQGSHAQRFIALDLVTQTLSESLMDDDISHTAGINLDLMLDGHRHLGTDIERPFQDVRTVATYARGSLARLTLMVDGRAPHPSSKKKGSGKNGSKKRRATVRERSFVMMPSTNVRRV
jgi:hypothetical protein